MNLMFVPIKTPRDALEGLSALLLMAWGAVLFLPGEAFQRAGGYRNMAEIAPEWAWAAFFMTVGIAQIVAGARNRYRRIVDVVAVVAWGVPAVCFAWLPMPLHAPAIYGMLAVSMAWCARSKQ